MHAACCGRGENSLPIAGSLSPKVAEVISQTIRGSEMLERT